MSTTTPQENRALVLEAFDTLFNRLDYAAAERFWSQDYIQHSARIARDVIITSRDMARFSAAEAPFPT
jgi:predicted SnoaL-like aldol condensation-catalyzing enzyme